MKKLSNGGMATYLRSQQALQRQLRHYARRHRHWLLFGLACLSLTAYMSIHRAVYLVPYGLDRQVAVSVTQVTPYYLALLARNDAATYFNVTPQTIDNASALFLTRLRPSFYGKLQVPMQQRAASYHRDNQSTAFFPMAGATINSDRVTLRGNLITLIGDKITRHQTITLRVVYASTQGTRYIAGWEYE